MNTTSRRYPRTLEEAFGPNRLPISGPYRRQSPAASSVLDGLALIIMAGLAVFCVAAVL